MFPLPSEGSVFDGSNRFAVKRLLGRGGMGAVYEVTDRVRGVDVALKTLIRVDPRSILRFKQEFRALADVHHANLVSLYELMSDGDEWFFTMELLRGVDVVSHVRGARIVDPESVTDATIELQLNGHASERTALVTAALDYGRVRDVMSQLVEGVEALHACRYLHRDIKPSNVMVTEEGRVVLLDFGIVAQAEPGVRATATGRVLGTPVYMAPEQFDGQATPASDWYAVGALLHRVLTGRAPFAGTPSEILTKKTTVSAPRPSLFDAGVPAHLDQLCSDLLNADPALRPRASEILARLTRGARKISSAARPVVDDAPLVVGRDEELSILRRAFDRTSAGAPEIVLVHGDSGVGKSALVRSFLEEPRRGGALVLEGRCYERESVPFKGIDSIVDALTRHLMALPVAEAEALMPRDVRVLARIFPVLLHVVRAVAPPVLSIATLDPHEARARAFAALRELLQRLSSRRPLVLFVDDLQWGDADSLQLMELVMRPPQSGALLLVGCYRRADPARCALLDSLPARLGPELRATNVELRALPEDRATELAACLLERAAAPASAAASIARESAGHPYFIHELVRFRIDHPGGTSPGLEAVIERRVAALDAPTRALMRAVAVAGRPVAQGVAREAAGLEQVDVSRMLIALRSAQLLRSTGVRKDDLIECYHDRIRETLVGNLSPEERTRVHRAIAVALRRSGNPDPEALAEHYHAAGETELAATYFAAAAERASSTLSFARAAQLYMHALELENPAPERRRELCARIGEAAAHAGRGALATEYYGHAAALSRGVAATALRLRAGQHALCGGQIAKGENILHSVVADLDMRLPATRARRILGLLYRRTELRARGLGFRRRPPSACAEIDRLRVDACWALGAGFSQFDPERAAIFGPHGVLYALRLGDPFRVVRAIALEAGFVAAAGAASRRRALKLAAAASAIAPGVEDERTEPALHMMLGFIDFETGRFRDAFEHFELAERALRERCTNVFWELGAAQMFSLAALLVMGHFGLMERLAHRRLAGALERGDVYQATNIRTLIVPATFLRRADPAGALQDLGQALAEWGHEGFDSPAFNAVVMSVQAHLFAGDARAAWSLCSSAEHKVRASPLQHVQIVRGYWLNSRAISAIALAAYGGDEREALLRGAAKDARCLAREKVAWCVGLGHLAQAGVEHVRGRREIAAARLRAAIDVLESADMSLHAAAARYRLGSILGGDEGSALVARARSAFVELGLVDHPRVPDSVAPGYT